MAAAKYIELSDDSPWNVSVASVTPLLAPKEAPPILVDLFIAEAGISGAIDALRAANHLGRFSVQKTAQAKIEQVIGLQTRFGHSRLECGEPGLWTTLRDRIASADEATYREAYAYASKARMRFDWHERCALSYAFPKETAWAEADLMLPDARSAYLGCPLLLLPSLRRPELFERVANMSIEFGPALADGRVRDVMRRFGTDALPFAKRLLMKRSKRSLVVDALGEIDSPEVIDVLLGVYDDSHVREHIAAFLRARPRLALGPIASAIVKSNAQERLLKPLLASLVTRNRALAIELSTLLPSKEQALVESLGASEWLVKKCDPKVKALLDAPPAADAARDAWTKMGRWMQRGAPEAKAGCIADLVSVADPSTIVRLAELARTTAKHGGLPCAMAIVDALEASATDGAVRQIARMTIDLVEPTLGEHAEEALRRLQTRLGLDDEEIADRSVPDFGATGPIVTLDFGPRSFRVELDATCRPRLLDDKGALMKSLPRPRKTDDAEKATRATATWATLRDESPAVGKQQASRWEQAMISGRHWSPASFRDVILSHPILSNLARRVLWIAEDGPVFRVAEDLSFANVKDDPIDLPNAKLRLPHVLELGHDLQAWRTLLTGYEILQPFEQLMRSAPSLDGASLADTLSAFANRPTRSAAAHHILEGRGWEMSFVGETEARVERTIRGRHASMLLRVPGPHGGWDELAVLSVAIAIEDEPNDVSSQIAIAEVLRDLQAIVA